LTHWGDDYTILELETAELKRLENPWNGLGVVFMGDGCPGRNLLARCEIGYLGMVISSLVDLDMSMTMYLGCGGIYERVLVMVGLSC